MVGIILLAAGNSSRLGQSKQLIKIGGIPLLRKTTLAATHTHQPVVVVLGADAQAHQQVIHDLPAHSIIHTNWHLGMGSSLKAGLIHLLRLQPDIDGVLILVCDQPYLTTEHLQKIISEFVHNQPQIVASAYNNTSGVPALFHKALFPELLKLADDAGARKIIQQPNRQINTVPFDKGDIDIDTPDNLLHLPEN